MAFAHKRPRYLIGLALALGLAQQASAAVYVEIGASVNFNGGAGPEAVGPGIDRINGTINGADNGDLFRLEFDTGGTLIILGRTLGASVLNPVLFLFDSSGAGIRADNDSGPLDSARIEVTIVPGTYFIGFGDDPLQAVDTDGSIWSGFGAVNAAPPSDFGILSRIENTGVIISPDNYVITLSIATAGQAVPEPTALSLLGAGLFGLGAAARRRRRLAG